MCVYVDTFCCILGTIFHKNIFRVKGRVKIYKWLKNKWKSMQRPHEDRKNNLCVFETQWASRARCTCSFLCVIPSPHSVLHCYQSEWDKASKSVQLCVCVHKCVRECVCIEQTDKRCLKKVLFKQYLTRQGHNHSESIFMCLLLWFT